MRNILNIMHNCRKRSWIVIVFSIGLGLFLGFIQQFLGFNFNEDFSKMKVVVIEQEDNVFTRNLNEYLEKQLNIEVKVSKDYDEYTEDLLDRDLSAIIELEADFYSHSIENKKSQSVSVTTIDNYANEAYLRSYLNVYLKSMDLIFQSANGDQKLADQMIEDLNLAQIKVVGADDSIRERSCNYSGFTLTSGFYLNFIWILGMFLGLMIISDRLDGTFLRIQGTPIKGFQYILGTVTYYIICGLLTPLIFIGILKIRGIDVGVNYWLIALIIFIINIFVVGLSMIIALLVNSKIGVAVGVYVSGGILAILGGAYFDLSGISGSLEKIYRLAPTYWFMDCIRSSQTDVNFKPTLNIIILALMAVLSLLIAGVLFNRQMETKE